MTQKDLWVRVVSHELDFVDDLLDRLSLWSEGSLSSDVVLHGLVTSLGQYISKRNVLLEEALTADE